MYFLLKMGIFHDYVSLPEGTIHSVFGIYATSLVIYHQHYKQQPPAISPKPNMTGCKIHHLKMYFLLKMEMFQLVMLAFGGVMFLKIRGGPHRIHGTFQCYYLCMNGWST